MRRALVALAATGACVVVAWMASRTQRETDRASRPPTMEAVETTESADTPDETSETSSPSASIARVVSGTVKGHDGRALANARICLYRSHSSQRAFSVQWDNFVREPLGDVVGEARSGVDGTFFISVPSRGTCFAEARAPGFWPDRESIREGPVEFVLHRSRRVTVRVVDESGSPIAAAVIRSYVFGIYGPPWDVRKTDANGETRVVIRDPPEELLSPESWLVGAPGYATRLLEEHASEFYGEPIVLKRGHVLAGVVVTSDGDPLPGATVLTSVDFERVGMLNDVHYVVRVRTDHEGRFRFDGLRQKERVVVLREARYATVEHRAYPSQLNLRLVALRSAHIEGVARRADGTPLTDRAAVHARA